jgi:hypothetical protein
MQLNLGVVIRAILFDPVHLFFLPWLLTALPPVVTLIGGQVRISLA